MVGDEVALGCRVVVAEPWDLLRLEWVKDGGHGALCATRLHPTALASPAPCAPRLHLAWHPPRATLSLRQAQGDDAGRYLCRVTLEIPHHGMATGNGTLLSVSTGTPRGPCSAPPPWGPEWGLWEVASPRGLMESGRLHHAGVDGVHGRWHHHGG